LFVADAEGVAHARAGRASFIGRALRLRCPNCGAGRVMRSWFTMNRRCAACGLRVTWPAPPWRRLLYGGGAVMVVTPIVLDPSSRALWLAIDLVFRPAQPEDFAA